MPGKTIALALQGGGSHGAFTWGVLDRLLEDGRLEIEGVSGASAGAMNAVLLAYGHSLGGRDGAREALREFWGRVALKAPFSLLSEQSWVPATAQTASPLPTPVDAYLAVARFLSPYQINPFDINPLRDILAQQIDFERLRRNTSIRLFIAATHVGTGKRRLFRNRQLTLDVLLASACLPLVHQAVEIDGEAYWDGGFSANPPIYPLLHRCRSADIVAVLLDSHPHPGTPSTSAEITARLTEIGFNSALNAELEGIAMARREAKRSLLSFGRVERRLRNLNMHTIESHEFMSRLSARSKLNTFGPFINALRDEGRLQAERWLDANGGRLGASPQTWTAWPTWRTSRMAR